MNIHVKTLLTLAVLVVLLLVGVTWGFTAATKPFPQRTAEKPCYEAEYHPGQRISPPLVLVSVYNASDRGGLAERTLSAFGNQGFGTGNAGNAPDKTIVHYAQVWASNPESPDVRLVASRLGPKARVVQRNGGTEGVVVVVGPKFAKLVHGKPSVKVTDDITLCSPPT